MPSAPPSHDQVGAVGGFCTTAMTHTWLRKVIPAYSCAQPNKYRYALSGWARKHTHHMIRPCQGGPDWYPWRQRHVHDSARPSWLTAVLGLKRTRWQKRPGGLSKSFHCLSRLGRQCTQWAVVYCRQCRGRNQCRNTTLTPPDGLSCNGRTVTWARWPWWIQQRQPGHNRLGRPYWKQKMHGLSRPLMVE